MPVADARHASVCEPDFASVFPLPLTTLESFMVADSKPDYPMMCDLEIHCRGRVDRPALEAALAFAAARNPLFSSRIDRTRAGLAWVPNRAPAAVQTIGMQDQPDASYGAPTDLASKPGLRVWVRQGEDEASIVVHFHHACSDAVGGLGFIEDMMAGYAAACPGGPRIEPRPLAPDRLKGRGELGLAGRSWWRRIHDEVAGAREGARFLLQAPAPLAPAAGPAGDPASRPGFPLNATCSDDVTAALRRVARDARATLNDVLLRDLFVTLQRWNQDCGGQPERQRLRILMPQNLRGPEDAAMPAANAMGFAFLTRRSPSCDDPQEMLHALRDETDTIRRGQLSLYFLAGLAWLQSARVQSLVLGTGMCFATAVLTNIGDPLRQFVTQFPVTDGGLAVGNLIVHGITGVPPLRPQTHAAIAIAINRGRLSISCRADHRRYSAVDARRFLDAYLARLHATAGRAVLPSTHAPATALQPERAGR